MTIEQVFAYLEKIIAEGRVASDRTKLRHAQTTCGTLMEAAQVVDERDTAARFRVLAAKAANYIEEIENS